MIEIKKQEKAMIMKGMEKPRRTVGYREREGWKGHERCRKRGGGL
jgi:hypothetical protein